MGKDLLEVIQEEWSVLNLLSDSLLIIDKDKKIIMANSASYDTFDNLTYSIEQSDICSILCGQNECTKCFLDHKDLKTKIRSPIKKKIKINDKLFSTLTIPKFENDNLLYYLMIIKDISKDQLILNKIKENEEKFKSIFDNYLMGISFITEEGPIICNDKLADIFELDKEIILKMDLDSFINIIHEKDKDFVKSLIKKRFEETYDEINDPYEIVIKCDSKDKWILITLRLMKINKEKIILLCVSDNTNFKITESSLLKQRDLMRAMADNMVDLLWSKDLDGKYIFVNQKMCDLMLGCKYPEQAIGKTPSYFEDKINATGLYHTIGRKCQETDEEVIKYNKPISFEDSGYALGEYTCLDINKSPLIGENGKLIGIVGNARDVTSHVISIERSYKALEIINEFLFKLSKTNLDYTILDTLLEKFGIVIDSDRAYIFQKIEEDGICYYKQLKEWINKKRDVISFKDKKGYQQIPCLNKKGEPFEWHTIVQKGETLFGPSCNFSKKFESILNKRNSKSFAIFAITIIGPDNESVPWGFVGFDDCTNDRNWNRFEIQALEALGRLLGLIISQILEEERKVIETTELRKMLEKVKIRQENDISEIKIMTESLRDVIINK